MKFSFDPFHIFQVDPQACHIVLVTVLCGRDITKGRLRDTLDTPDPYIQLKVASSPSGQQKTKVCDDTKDPTWNEQFKFIIDPSKPSTLEVQLWESNIISDDDLGIKLYDLDGLTIAETTKVMITFGTKGEVDLEILRIECNETDVRHGLTLCDQEKAFIQQRKQKVLEAMKQTFGEDAPGKLEEVPLIGVLGSGGGFRAMTGLAGAFTALRQGGILDMVTYTAGLSGSAWYLAQLYANPEWKDHDPAELTNDLKHRVKRNWVSKAVDFGILSRYMEDRRAKRRRGQPTSFTDWFGHLLGEILLPDGIPSCLSEQASEVADGSVPLPLYCSVHVKPKISAQSFSEWVEFSPFEISIPKYGTSLSPHLLNSSFYLGRLVTPCPEPPLHFLMGMWGSAFTILLARLTHTNGHQNEDEVDGIGEEELVEDDEEDDETDEEVEEEEDEDREEHIDNLDGAMSNTEAGQSIGERILHSLLMSKRLNTRKGRAAKVLNFLNGINFSLTHPFCPFAYTNDLPVDLDEKDSSVNISTARSLYMVDAGLNINLPFPLLLRQQRALDLIISYDFSAREKDNDFPFKELKQCEEWARTRGVPFPPIDITEEDVAKDGTKECYVFSNPDDDMCPVVVHFVLINDSFRRYKAPGVERTTEEELKFANFSIFEDKEKPYSTFNFTYTEKSFERLSSLTAYNTLNNINVIQDAIKQVIGKRRRRATASWTNWELALNITLAKVDFNRISSNFAINLERMAKLQKMVDRTRDVNGSEIVSDGHEVTPRGNLRPDEVNDNAGLTEDDINLAEKETDKDFLNEADRSNSENDGFLCGGNRSKKSCAIL